MIFLRALILVVGIIVPTAVAADEFRERELTEAVFVVWHGCCTVEKLENWQAFMLPQ